LSACFNPYGTHRQRVAAAITAWLAEQAAPNKPGHVKVRAAVAVAADGEWAVYGHRDEDDTVVATQAAHLTSSSRPDEYFIETQVPLPKPPATIQAHVEDVA
jgi:hypothetical protein